MRLRVCLARTRAVLNAGLFLTTVVALVATAEAAARLELVSARDNILGSMTNAGAIHADATRIYLATQQPPANGTATGRLYVLARDRAANFPVVEVLEFPAPLRTVTGDDTYLYVPTGDRLLIYRKTSPLTLVESLNIPGAQGNAIAHVGDRIYIAKFQGRVAADVEHVIVSMLNPEDFTLEVVWEPGSVDHLYGRTFEPNRTVVFDRLTGARLTSLPNPEDGAGGIFAIPYVDEEVLVLLGGAHGEGLTLYDPETLVADQSIVFTGANAAARRGPWLIVGNEAGNVMMWNIATNPATFGSGVNLRPLTGHTGIEDIEIRALWTDGVDNLVFAGSSWGNEQSRSPSLPAFFVLELVEDAAKPTVTITQPSGNVWTGNSITVGASATDDVGLVNIKLWGNGAVFATIPCSGKTCSGGTTWVTGSLPAAAYEVNAVATDTAGNQTISNKVTIFKDATTPVKPSGATVTGGGGGGTTPPPLGAAITSPTNGTTVSSTVTVNMSASNAQGTPTFTLRVDNGATLATTANGSTASASWNTTGVANGTHTLNLTVTDGARTASAAVSVIVNNPTGGGGGGGDTTAPTVSITSPTGNVWTGNSINIAATASDNLGLASIKLWGNGAVFATLPCSGTTCSGNAWWSTGSLPTAAYEVNAVATDTAGNQTISGKVTIFKDATTPVKLSGATAGAGGGGGGTTPPALGAAITSPTNGTTVNGTVTVNMSASNAQGTPAFTLKVDNGATLATTASGSSATASWNTTGLANGTHTLNLTVTDGTRTATAAGTVTVNNPTGGGGGGDTTAPSVTITSPPNGAWTGNSIDVTATAGDNAGLATLKFFGNGTQFAQVNCSGTTCTSTQWWLTGSLPSGKHTITVVATDTAGNTQTSAPVVINK